VYTVVDMVEGMRKYVGGDVDATVGVEVVVVGKMCVCLSGRSDIYVV